MSVTGGIMAGVSAAGSLASGFTQAGSADDARRLMAQKEKQATDWQNNEWSKQQENQNPFLQSGQSAVLRLSDLLSKPGSGLLSPYGEKFSAPTLAQAENDPGYQFQLQQGQQAIQNSAAARGQLLDPNTQRALLDFGQNSARTDYGNVYNRALQTYGTNYDVWHQGQQDQYGRLLGLTNVGAHSADSLGQEGQAAANNMSGILLGSAQHQGQDMMAAGTAMASGYAGAANGINNGIMTSQYYNM